MKSLRIKQLAILIMTGLPGVTLASGFALIEQSASGLGTAFAGAAASAEDASTIFFNPAGMTLLPEKQLVVAGHLIEPSARFSGTVSPPIGGGQGGDAGSLAFVPNVYFAYQLAPDLHLGVGINSLFGLTTEYDASWVGRVQAIKSDLKTVNINPSIAYRISDSLSLGAGFSFQHVEAELTSFAGALGTAKIKAKDDGWGFNLGALWQLSAGTRLGLAYRSQIDYGLHGSASFSANPAVNGPLTADLTVPDSASLSLFHRPNPQWDVLADVTWTGWNVFNKLLINMPAPIPDSLTVENWKDSWRYSLGANYHMDEKLTLRGGLAFDQTPVPDATHRTPRIPDEDRTWLAFGGQYKISKQGSLDLAYAHLFVKDPSINSAAGGTTLTGKYSNHIDILSAQYTHTF